MPMASTCLRTSLGAIIALMALLDGPSAISATVQPFESKGFTPSNRIDALVLKALEERDIEPANLCSDAVFFRRVHLDVIGALPEPRDIRVFLKDRSAEKRAAVIDDLLKRDEFADFWSLKWGDLLRVKAEFPINLWPNGVQAYHRWIRDSIVENKPYDQFVRELLTSSGSNFRVPPVNFYRAIQGQEPSSMAAAAALTFMGARFEDWPEKRRAGMEAFFSRVAFKPTSEWKEAIVQLDPEATGVLQAVYPDGEVVRIPSGVDPRVVFADWLITPENPWFARNIVNRVWFWLMGRGIIHEPDDIRPNNPPTNPELLAFLEEELVKADYDLRRIYRLILNSNVYQQSSIPRDSHPEAESLFAQYPVRQLEAEVLVDALNRVFQGVESYQSPIPEPFTFIPQQHRTVELSDGSISSQFLEMFGRPSRDTGLESERNREPTEAQRLHFLNSSHIQDKIEKSWRIKQMIQNADGNRRSVINSLYLIILSRSPTSEESDAAEEYFSVKGTKLTQGTHDLAWALVNTKEFLYRH
jgi:hypothetical protein